MSFYGSSFSFDGVSCEEYGLMMYDFNTTSQGASEFAPGMAIKEDRITGRTRSLFYGAYHKDPLTFTLVFGADEHVARNGEDIDRQEMEVIGSWLTGHSEYKWLVIDQPDMESIRYRCILTDLKVLEHAGNKWAFTCKVHCDSPFAYTQPEAFLYSVTGSSDVILRSRSSVNTPYSPIVKIAPSKDGDISIVNHSDKDREFKLSKVPASIGAITINGESGVITSASGMDVYQYFNFVFPRLVRGINRLTISGSCTVEFECSFPVNVGG